MSFQPDDAMTEFGQLFNFDQATVPSQAQKGKNTVSPQFTAPAPDAYIPPQQPTFQGPSHQYELFKQHTSLTPGALSSMQRTRQVPSQNYIPMFDMNDADGASFGGMDMDIQSDMFDASSMNGFVDPSSVGAGSEAGDASPVAQPVQRLWPGMHQQHAAAKEQKKLEQQKLQEQQRIALAQQQLGAPSPSVHQRRSSHGRNRPSDPLVEERISQILRTMRQNNSRPAQSTTPPSAMAQPARQRKEEEDMDEDERLLASEEGKKLSSKERRQLRNKVSARAFRSRRKEYISQLEGELQVKTQEADELQFDNDALRAENAQLTDLARMLLSQPAFSNVLEDLAARGSSMPLMAAQNTQHRQSIPQSSQAPMSAPPTSQQPATTSMDFSTPMDGWNSDISAPEFNFNPNVYAVTELPEPILDITFLGDKAQDLPAAPHFPLDKTKTDYPVLERPTPKTDRPVISAALESMSDDLFEIPSSIPDKRVHASPTEQSGIDSTAPVLSEKQAFQQFELVSMEQAKSEEQALEARFTSLCERLDAMCYRIESMTSRS